MTKKILFSVFLLAFMMVGVVAVSPAYAQTASPFISGCSSGMGYSVTTGQPCNGTTNATLSNLPGCSTPLGYSVTNGQPCSGTSVALQVLAGCTSMVGYSVIDGDPCNGTSVATAPVVVNPGTPIFPGFPTTGFGGSAPLNIALLSFLGTAAVLGTAYFVRRYRMAK
ncbi:MAG TPA: hypothetical protein VFQ59_02470 [Candidatus Paceibacterota bacterium]|nr:hypothetical protein [Candidatus Paceibacterota bacterium]